LVSLRFNALSCSVLSVSSCEKTFERYGRQKAQIVGFPYVHLVPYVAKHPQKVPSAKSFKMTGSLDSCAAAAGPPAFARSARLLCWARFLIRVVPFRWIAPHLGVPWRKAQLTSAKRSAGSLCTSPGRCRRSSGMCRWGSSACRRPSPPSGCSAAAVAEHALSWPAAAGGIEADGACVATSG